jgi:predicted dehydrogenase
VVYPDLTSALRGGDLDAVLVSTPPDSHHALVGTALAAGKHVLCEKPLSDEMGEVIDLVQRAQENGRTLMVGMNFRYLSTSQRIRQVVQERQLGAVGYGQFTYVRHRDGNRDDLNDYPLTMPYPMLLEQSIHHFDLLRYCYDSEVESLVADSWRPSWSTYEKDCCVSVLFRFENGARVNYLGTWTASWNKMSFSWRTEFDSGVLIQQSQFDDLVRVDFEPELGLSGARFKTEEESEPGRFEKLPPCVPFIDDSRLLLAEFSRAVTGEAEAVTTGRDHLKSLGLVQACIESFETGSWVNLDALHKKLGVDVIQ